MLGAKAPGPKAGAIFLVTRFVDVQGGLLRQQVDQLQVGLLEDLGRFLNQFGQIPSRNLQTEHIGEKVRDAGVGSMHLAFEITDQAGQARSAHPPGEHRGGKRGVVNFLTGRTPIGGGDVLRDDKGLVEQFDLLKDFLMAWDELQVMASIHRAALERMSLAVINLFRGEGRSLVPGMTSLRSDFAALFPVGFPAGCLDNVTGGRFGGIARILFGRGQGLNQLPVLAFQLREAALQLAEALAQASILSLGLVTSLFPTKAKHGSARRTEDPAEVSPQGIQPHGLDRERRLMEAIVATAA